MSPDAGTAVLKLVLTPALIGTASLAGRRWGPSVSGWLVGLPLTSGPVALFLALNHGTAFAATAASGTMAGTISQVAFSVAYAWLAFRGGRVLAVSAGCLAFALSTAALRHLALPALPLFLAVVLALVLGLFLMPGAGQRAPAPAGPPPRWDLPARMGLATAWVLLLTGVAPALGARLTGLLSPFPLFAVILAGFAHHQEGPAAAAWVLRGLLLGLFSFAGFFLVLAMAIEPAGIAPAFAAAIALTLALQGVALWVLRR